MYLSIYYKLCQSKKQLKESWIKGSGLHRHHIIPIHSGGTDDENNFTYLTVREHIIAHFLLWKIHRNPNDLRATHMLGANLSPQYRKTIGEFCRDHKIGFHGATKEQRREWSRRGLEEQKQSGDKNTFYYWSSEEGRKKRASMGGEVGSQTQISNKIGIHNPENFKKNAILGGKAIKGMICVTNGTHRTRIKPDKLEEYISKGYRRGFTISF